MKLRDFKSRLQGLVGDADVERPFVCDGDPYACTAFLVGLSPASAVPFWQFWNDDTGFDKAAWFDCYRAHRKEEPLKERRIRRQPVSATRQRIEWIVEAAQPIRVLETNLYARPTQQASDLAWEDRTSDPFVFMLREIAPRVLLFHGKEVCNAFEARYRHPLNDTFTTMVVEGRTMKVAGVRHLSRDISSIGAEALGGALKSEAAS
jgi:hypothetical protein